MWRGALSSNEGSKRVRGGRSHTQVKRSTKLELQWLWKILPLIRRGSRFRYLETMAMRRWFSRGRGGGGGGIGDGAGAGGDDDGGGGIYFCCDWPLPLLLLLLRLITRAPSQAHAHAQSHAHSQSRHHDHQCFKRVVLHGAWFVYAG